MTSVDFNGPYICELILGATVLSLPVEGSFSVLRPNSIDELGDLIFFDGFKSKSPQVLERFSWKILLSVC